MPVKPRLSFSNFCLAVEKFWIPMKPECDFSSTTMVSCTCLVCSNVSVKKAVKFTEDARDGKSGCLHCFKVLSSTDEYKEKLKTRVLRRRLNKKIKKVVFPTRGLSFTFHHLSEATLKEMFECFSTAPFLRSKCLPEMKGDKRAPRPDFCFYQHRVIVEWDGPSHYTDPATILRDRKNQQIYESFGYRVLRIPYFIELNEDMEQMGFEVVDMITFSSYPHGFVRDGVILPAEFCELGVARFVEDLLRFPSAKREVLATLKIKARDLGDINLAVPPSLQAEVESLNIDGYCLDYYRYKQKTAVSPRLICNAFSESRLDDFISKIHESNEMLDIPREADIYPLYGYVLGGKKDYNEFHRVVGFVECLLRNSGEILSPENCHFISELSAFWRACDYFGDKTEASRLMAAVLCYYDTVEELLACSVDWDNPDDRLALMEWKKVVESEGVFGES